MSDEWHGIGSMLTIRYFLTIVFVIVVSMNCLPVWAGEGVDIYRLQKFRDMVKGVFYQDRLRKRGIEDQELERAALYEKASIVEARRWIRRRSPRWKYSFSQGLGYEDNIFSTTHDAKSSIIFNESPTIAVFFANRKLTLDGGYSFGLLEYLHQQSQSRFDQNWTYNVKYRLGAKTGVTLFSSFKDTQGAPNSIETTPRRSQTTNFTAEIHRRFKPRLTGTLRYHIRNTGFRKSSELDDNTDTFIFNYEIAYKKNSRISYFAHYNKADTRSPTIRFGSIDHIFGGGFEGRIGRKTIGFFDLSLKTQDVNERSGFAGFTVQGIFYHRISKHANATLTLNRDTAQSLDGESSYYVSNSAALHVTRRVTPRLSLSYFGLWRYTTADGQITLLGSTDTRENHSIEVGLNAAYRLSKSVSLGSGLTYNNSISNFPAGDYRKYIITGSLRYSI